MLGDCLELMKDIPDKSVDMILCDLPYNISDCFWDKNIIPLEDLWRSYERIIKDNGSIVLTAKSIFTARLIMSNTKLYRYSLVWEKTMAVGFLNAKKMPLNAHEDIVIFYKNPPTYNPQMTQNKPYTKKRGQEKVTEVYNHFHREGSILVNEGTRYPRSIIKIANPNHSSLHPTQKPVALFEYLIKTYTNENDLVLDNCAGSFTTAIACLNTNRNYICIEKEQKYYEVGLKRIDEYLKAKHA